MRKSGVLALLAVLLGAIWIRLSPLFHYLYWGSDSGEYFAVLRDLVTVGRVSTAYPGWGITYAYFPGVFYLPGGLVELAPVDVPTALDLVVPILGALAVLPVFLIGIRITGETKVALFAATLIAFVMPHVYPTSHTSPATLGDLLALSALLLFLRLRRDPRAAVPLGLVTFALVVTHHLSTYFLILMVLATLVLRGLLRPGRLPSGSKREIAYAGFLLASTLAFWFGYATTFRDGILRDVNVEPWWLLLAAFPAVLLGLAGLILLRRRVPWRFRPRYPDLRRCGTLYGITLAGVLLVMGFAVVRAVPGTSIAVPPDALYYFAPVYVLLAFSAPGRRFFDFLREGVAPGAWFLGLLGSIVVGAVAAPRTIIPYRHIEYLVVPLALFAGMGLFRILDLAGISGSRRTAAVAIAGILLASTALTAFPPPEILARWQEGARAPALDAAYWARGRVDGLLLADHRASTIAFGFGGVNATWDTTRSPLLAASFEDARSGLIGVPSPSGVRNVTYVWVDRDTEAGVQLFPWEPAYPMSPEAIGKFDESPFVKVFDNGYARIYWLAWGCDGSC